jgi:hypothetical protein
MAPVLQGQKIKKGLQRLLGSTKDNNNAIDPIFLNAQADDIVIPCVP